MLHETLATALTFHRTSEDPVACVNTADIYAVILLEAGPAMSRCGRRCGDMMRTFIGGWWE